MSGKVQGKTRHWQKINSDSADVISSSRVFQTWIPATVKAMMSTVDSLTGDTSRRLELADRSVHRRSATRV